MSDTNNIASATRTCSSWRMTLSASSSTSRDSFCCLRSRMIIGMGRRRIRISSRDATPSAACGHAAPHRPSLARPDLKSSRPPRVQRKQTPQGTRYPGHYPPRAWAYSVQPRAATLIRAQRLWRKLRSALDALPLGVDGVVLLLQLLLQRHDLARRHPARPSVTFQAHR